ncbi:MAG: efflux RND transporter permease subunit [Planctomycetia bacterium]|nr:efflux RND transporter permease subunit [Planctomycetia bacterium]
MIDRLIQLSIRNRGLVILCSLALALWGVYAAYQTPIDAVPDLSENQVIVYTDWPGHSPREIEDQVTFPLSRTLQGLAGVRAVRGSSDVNYSMLYVIFTDDIDFTTARRRVQERLSGFQESLPAGVTPHLAPDAIPTGQIFWYTIEGHGYDLGRLRDVQDWFVKNQLESVPGVAEVASVGGHVVEYHVDLDPFKMRDRRVELSAVLRELARSNAAVGGNVIHKGNAEYIVRGVGWLGSGSETDSDPDPNRVLHDLGDVLVPAADGRRVRLAELARVALGSRPRRGILEKDGNEVVGGVVLMRYGQNPLDVTRRLKEKILELHAGLPSGVRIVTCYERTPLIEGAVRTVTGTVVEAIVTATVCVMLVLMHFRTSFVIAVTLPLSALASFVAMWLLRRLGIADIQTNIMSLAGIAISIGVLVDSSIVIAENVMHHLREKFGDEPVRGDIRDVVGAACRTVGRPIVLSVLIMLVSFLPVFALGGIDGKMYRPLAFTKTFALLAVAILAVTLVPALCTIFIKGRIRRETDSWVVRSVVEVYRPVLNYLFDCPGVLVWVLGATLILGAAPLGNRPILLAVLGLALVLAGWTLRSAASRLYGMAALVLVALIAEENMQPLAVEMRMPLDEQMVMDMPLTVPRASSVQAGDDLKARDMVLCHFPEVEMVLGKAGRVESSFDPAPLDMIETMVMLRPREFWPRRKITSRDARRQIEAVCDALIASRLIEPPAGDSSRRDLLEAALADATFRYDGLMREFAYQRNQEFSRSLGMELARFLVERATQALERQGRLLRSLTPGEQALIVSSASSHSSEHLGMMLDTQDVLDLARHVSAHLGEQGLLADGPEDHDLHAGLIENSSAAVSRWLGRSPRSSVAALEDASRSRRDQLWAEHVRKLNDELLDRAGPTFTRVSGEELLKRATIADPRLEDIAEQVARARQIAPPAAAPENTPGQATQPPAAGHHDHSSMSRRPVAVIDPHPVLDKLYADLSKAFSSKLMLWPCVHDELAGRSGGELDSALAMPGWSNVWTMPIQNRVDMLNSGINTEIGVRVLGRRQDDVVRVSDAVAEVLRGVPGAAGVSVEQIRGKGYLEIRPDRDKAARLGVSIGDINDLIETAIGGTIATTTVEGRERHAVRVRYSRDWSLDEETIRRLPVPVHHVGPAGPELAIAAARQDRSPDAALHLTSADDYVPLEEVASVQIVEGPATIKSQNGLVRNHVLASARGRSQLEVVEAARRAVAESVELPEGTYLEWTGQFEHALETGRTLTLVIPVVIASIFLILYLTYHDWADACLMLLAVPGTVAGGILFQWLFGFKFSVAVAVGYIACFGMAASTGMIMLVYLREAVEKAGGLEAVSLAQLRQAVMDGAVHRLRPKLLTEGTMILGLAPMLWASGIGAEVIRPMAAPVLGGILIADEVIDLLLPVLFYHVRRRRWLKLQDGTVSADS